MLTLVISHNIALSKEQRYKLHNRETIDTVGVSVPVWFEKGNTSEPAQEVFVAYKLTNSTEDFAIKMTKDGYEINIPQPNPELESQLQSVNANVLEALGVQKEIPTSKNLLDVGDGGSAYIQFRQFAKSGLVIDGKKTKKTLSIVHSVEIRTNEELKQTLV